MHFSKYIQTLPSAVLHQRHLKAKKLRSRPTSSTSLLEDSDALHYHSTGDTLRRCGHVFTESENSAEVTKPPPLRDLLLMPRVLLVITNYGFLNFCELSIQVLTPLMWSTSLEHGGLGFSPYTIGLACAIYGILSVFFQAMVVGKVIRCFGPRRVFIGSNVPLLLSLFCFPLEGYLARSTGHTDWRVWSVIMVHLAMYCLATASYSELTLFVNVQMFIIRCDSGVDHGQCAMPVCPWFCKWLGSGRSIYFKLVGALFCVIVICHLTAAKLGWWERSLLHIDGYHGLWDPTFFHATQKVASTMNSPFRDALSTLYPLKKNKILEEDKVTTVYVIAFRLSRIDVNGTSSRSPTSNWGLIFGLDLTSA